MSKYIRGLFVVSATALTACGGGSSQSSPEPVTKYPVASVLMQLATKSQTFSGKYTPSSGGTKNLRVTYTAVAANQFSREQTIAADGATQSTQQGTMSFDSVSGLFQIKTWTNDIGAFTIFSGDTQNPAPISANVGTSGTLAEVRRSDPSGAIFESRSLTWSLASVSPSTADLCIGYNYASQWGGGTNTDCFLIGESGGILGYKGIARFSVAHVSANEVYQ